MSAPRKDTESVGCGYCMDCGYGGEPSPDCLHQQPATAELLAWQQALRDNYRRAVAEVIA